MQLSSLILKDVIRTMSNVLNHNSLTIKIDGNTLSHVLSAIKETNKIDIEARRLGMLEKQLSKTNKAKNSKDVKNTIYNTMSCLITNPILLIMSWVIYVVFIRMKS